MKKISIFLITIISLVFFNGCAQQADIKPRVTDPHIIVENTSLYNWLDLEKVNYFKRDDGLLVVEAKFKNYSTFNHKVAYKIDWIDKNGFTEKSILSRWVVAEVEQRRALVIKGIAPSIKITDFEIRLQNPTSDDANRKDSYHSDYQN